MWEEENLLVRRKGVGISMNVIGVVRDWWCPYPRLVRSVYVTTYWDGWFTSYSFTRSYPDPKGRDLNLHERGVTNVTIFLHSDPNGHRLFQLLSLSVSPPLFPISFSSHNYRRPRDLD